MVSPRGKAAMTGERIMRHNLLWRLAVASLPLCVVLTGCATPYERGMSALAEGDTAQATQHARQALKKEPNSPELHLLMARALVAKAEAEPGRVDTDPLRAALPHARQAYKAKRLASEAGRTLGKIYWELGRYHEAADAWRTARAADATSVSDADYLIALMSALRATMALGMYDEAMALREELRKLAADRPALRTEENAEDLDAMIAPEAFHITREAQAQALRDARKIEQATAAYSALAKSHPERADYLYELGLLKLQGGAQDEAIEAFEAFARHQDGASSPEVRIARLREVAQRAEALGARGVAIQFYAQTLEAMGPAPSLELASMQRKLAQLHLELREGPEARRYLDAYLATLNQVHGEERAAHYLTVWSMSRAHDPGDLGIDYLERAMTIAPPNRRLTETLAEVYAQRARSGDVERVLKKYVERMGQSAEAYDQAARWAARRRSYELAQFFAERHVQLPGASRDDWFRLAEIYAAQARVDLLRQAVDRYLKLSSQQDQLGAMRQAAELYLNQNLFEEAEKLLKRAQKQHPEDLSLVDRLMTLYDRWGRPQEVHQVYAVWLKARGNRREDQQVVGERLLRQGRMDDALPYLQRAASAGEREAWLQIANIAIRQQREREVKLALAAYLSDAPRRDSALREVLPYYRRSTLTEETVAALEELITLEPSVLSHYEQLAELYLDQGRERDAMALLQRYLDQSGASHDARYRALSDIARQLERRNLGHLMLRFYEVLLAQPDPDPRLYLEIGDTLASIHQRSQGFSGRSWVQEEHPTLRKAERYYTLYLEQATLTSSLLSSFAQRMMQRRLFALSERAYAMLFERDNAPGATVVRQYATVLFEQGKPAQAEAMLTNYSEQDRSSESANLIATLLMERGLYRAAQPHLERLLRSRQDGHTRLAFERLALIYARNDQAQDLRALIETYLSQARNPAQARVVVVRSLRELGQWPLVVQQLEQMTRTRSADLRLELAQAQDAAGQREQAATTLRDYASDHPQPEEAWLQVAQFYTQRGLTEQADAAHLAAVNANPDGASARAARALVLASRGALDEATQEMQRALTRAPLDQQSELRLRWLQALVRLGRGDDALRAARDAIGVVGIDQAPFLNFIAQFELQSGDPVRADRMIQDLRASSIDLEAQLRLLSSNGYHERAATILEEEIAVGDYGRAASLLTSPQIAAIFLNQGGVTRLLQVAQPLLDRPRDDARLEESLGQLLIQTGHLAQGALYLRAAIDRGHTSARLLLADVYLVTGELDEAARLIEQTLLSVEQSSGRREVVSHVASRYLVMQQRQRLRAMLEHLGQDPQLVQATTPSLMAVMIEGGELLSAISMLRQLYTRHERDAMSPLALTSGALDEAQRLDLYLSGAHLIAGYGYIREALTLLEQLPPALASAGEVLALRARLEVLHGAPDAQGAITALLNDAQTSTAARTRALRLATFLTLAEQHERAREIALPALQDPSPEVATLALRVLLQSARVKGDEAKVTPAWIARFIEGSQDRARSRSVAAEQLEGLGLDAQALALREENLRRMPSEWSAQSALTSAALAGQPEQLRDIGARARGLSETSASALAQLPSLLVLHQDPDHTLAMLAPLLKQAPHDLELRTQAMSAMILRGDMAAARDAMRAILDDAERDPLAAEQLLRALSQLKMHAEIITTVAPLLDEPKRSTTTSFIMAEAAIALGFEPEATQHIERYVSRRADLSDALIACAELRMRHQQHEAAAALLERAIAASPERPATYAVRARLNIERGRDASEDLARSLDGGVGAGPELGLPLQAALKAKRYDLAMRLTEQLVAAPVAPPIMYQPDAMLSFAINYWARSPEPAEGVKRLGARYPELLSGRLSSLTLATSLTNLYEAAKLPERGYAIYKEHLTRQLITLDDPATRSATLPTYYNNLAYTYATTNQHVDEGERLVRKSIALEGARNASYIDTLGWIFFRQGKLEAAEAEIRRALRTSSGVDRGGTGGAAELLELYEHLADIQEARGQVREAAWTRAMLDAFRD